MDARVDVVFVQVKQRLDQLDPFLARERLGTVLPQCQDQGPPHRRIEMKQDDIHELLALSRHWLGLPVHLLQLIRDDLRLDAQLF